MNASVTARELARATLVDTIKQAARQQVAAEGAARLSVRAVAREVGMVSSAVYRYFPSRDDLLTALIVDAYDSLGAAVEQAVATLPHERAVARWRAACSAVRAWGTARPQEYGLIFGSPVPGYRAPTDTLAPASRVPAALLSVVRNAWTAGRLPAATDPQALPEVLSAQLTGIGRVLDIQLPTSVLLAVAMAWTHLFGLVTFELFGQLAGTLDPADEFFATSVSAMADAIGLLPD